MSNKIKVKYGNTELFSTDYPYNALDIKYKNNIVSTIYPEETVGLNTKEKLFDGNFDISGYTLNTSGTRCAENISISNELPYEELEYIESTGTLWIDTGYMPTTTSSAILIAGLTNTTLGVLLFGAYSTGCIRQITTYQGNIYLQNVDTDSISGNTPITIDTNIHTYRIYPNSNTIDGIVSSTSNVTSSSSVTYAVFTRNGSGQNPASMKFFNLTITDDGSTIRNFIPIKRKSDNVICLYDTVTNQYFENAGTGDFIAGPVVLYSKLEYIESSGTQYIDSLISAPNGFHMDFDIAFLNFSTYLVLIGAIDGGNPYNRNQLFVDTEGVFSIEAQYDATVDGTIITNLKYRVECSNVLDNIWFKLDGVTKSYDTSAPAAGRSSRSLYLLALHNTATPLYFVSCKLYGAKIYTDNLLRVSFVPVKRSGSNEYGLLDTVSHVFYRNLGTGKFIGHTKLPDEYTRLNYLLSTGVQWVNTGYIHNTNTWIDTTAEFTELFDYNMLCGQWTGLAVSLKSGGNMTIGCNGEDTQSLAVFSANTRYNMKFGSGTHVIVNDTAYVFGTGPNTTCAYPFFIFGAGATYLSGGKPYSWTSYGKVKLYAFDIYEGSVNTLDSVLVHSYVPVKRNIDDVLGLYDYITGEFLTNQGTGEFIGG